MKLHPVLENKKLILFDFDGTLVDSMSMWVGIDETIFAINNLPVPQGLTERLIPLNEEETAQVFLEYGCQGTVESIRALHDQLAQEQYDHHIQLKSGVREVLEELRDRGMQLGIVSASVLSRMLPCITRLSLDGYFSTILPCGELGMNKHTADPYTLLLETLMIDPEDAVFVDDFYGNLNGAKLAGLTTIGVYDAVGHANWKKMQAYADLSVLSLADLLLKETE